MKEEMDEEMNVNDTTFDTTAKSGNRVAFESEPFSLNYLYYGMKRLADVDMEALVSDQEAAQIEAGMVPVPSKADAPILAASPVMREALESILMCRDWHEGRPEMALENAEALAKAALGSISAIPFTSEAKLAMPDRRPVTVLDDVAVERRHQDAKWGGARHDDEHPLPFFVQTIQDYAGWARVMWNMDSFDKMRKRLVQVAALAVAAVESMDRRFGKPAARSDNGEAGNGAEQAQGGGVMADTAAQRPWTPEGCVYGPWWDEGIKGEGCWCYSDGELSYAWLPNFYTWVVTEKVALRKLLSLSKREQALTSFIRKTIELYGKPGGPWNIPSDPGGWLHEARQLVGEPSISHEEAMKEAEE